MEASFIPLNATIAVLLAAFFICFLAADKPQNTIYIKPPATSASTNEACSRQELMYFIYSAFGNMGKKRAGIMGFLYQVFTPYFPTGTDALSKKMPGWKKVKERRAKER